MAGSVTIQERVEDEGFLAAFGGGRRRIGPVIRIEHARSARSRLMVRILLSGRCRLRRGVRRQVEHALAPAAAKRERGSRQHNDGPSRQFRAVIASHDNIPNARAPYKHCLALASAAKLLFRLSQPNFRSFSSRLSQPLACASTFFGAVPP